MGNSLSTARGIRPHGLHESSTVREQSAARLNDRLPFERHPGNTVATAQALAQPGQPRMPSLASDGGRRPYPSALRRAFSGS